MLKISLLAILLLKQLEGFEANVYQNGGGRETIGYGHLVRAGEDWSNGITRDEAERLLNRDLVSAENAVRSLVTVPLSQHQYDALVIWTYNLGSLNLKTSTLLKRLNLGDYNSVPAQMMRWVHVKHKDTGIVEKLDGLVNRRAKEVELWKRPASE